MFMNLPFQTMQYKKVLILAFTFLIVSVVFVGLVAKSAYAGCKCASSGTTDQTAGNWIAYDDGSVPNGCDPLGTGGPGDCMDTNPATSVCGPCNPLTQAKINMWFRVPTLGDLIGNVLRLMFFIAGLYALVLLLLGGFQWVSSGGEEKKLGEARNKIINAIIGLVVMVAVLTLVILLEQVVFGGKVCLGISCPINMGQLSIIK